MYYKTPFPLLILLVFVVASTGCFKESESYQLNQEKAMELDGTWRVSSFFLNTKGEMIPDRWIAVVLNFEYKAGTGGTYRYDFTGTQDIGRTTGRFEITDDGKILVRDPNSKGAVNSRDELELNGNQLVLTHWHEIQQDSISSRFVATRQ